MAELQPTVRDLEDLLATLWLYINWRFVTKQLTTPQRELFADVIDARHARLNSSDPGLNCHPVQRWWRSRDELPRHPPP